MKQKLKKYGQLGIIIFLIILIFSLNKCSEKHAESKIIIDTSFNEEQIREKDSIIYQLEYRYDSLMAIKPSIDKLIDSYEKKINQIRTAMPNYTIAQRDSIWSDYFNSER